MLRKMKVIIVLIINFLVVYEIPHVSGFFTLLMGFCVGFYTILGFKLYWKYNNMNHFHV